MTTIIIIDHLILEKNRNEEGDFIVITRFGKEGEKMPTVEFKKGDKEAAYKFLDNLAEFFGVK